MQKNPTVAFFHKHVVPILIWFKADPRGHCSVISAFVVSLRDTWLLVTAGHCLRQVEKNVENGHAILRCRLVDSAGEGAIHEHFVPFDFIGAQKAHLHSDHLDYAIISIDENTRRALASNNIVPLDERVWDLQPNAPIQYQLLGVPADSVETQGGRVSFRSVLARIEDIGERPECFEATQAPTFYGRLLDDEFLKDMDGMSGGPIFSIQILKSGEMRYWLHALQSRWMPDRRLIAAPKTAPFFRWLSNEVSGGSG